MVPHSLEATWPEAGRKLEPGIPIPQAGALQEGHSPDVRSPAAPTRKLPSSSAHSLTSSFPMMPVGAMQPPDRGGKALRAASRPRQPAHASALRGPPRADSPVRPDAALPGSRSVRKLRPIRSKGAPEVLPPHAEAWQKRSDCVQVEVVGAWRSRVVASRS